MPDHSSSGAADVGADGDGGLTSLERALDTALFWPFELGGRAAGQLPDVAAKVREQLVFARFIGRLAVQQGNAEIRRRLERPRADELPPPADPADSTAPGSPTDCCGAEDLALPDYDQLPAAHIIDKLGGLTAQERDMIEIYEAAHRGRRTVLGKLERLRS